MLGSIVVSLDTVLDPGPCYETINDNVLVSDSSQVRNLYYIKKIFFNYSSTFLPCYMASGI